MAEWEDYLLPGTNVLKNNYGITSPDELKRLEEEIVLKNLSKLYLEGMEGNFDVNHLCEINFLLFGELYDFAGKFREVDVFKKTGFEPYQNIPSKLSELFIKKHNEQVNTENKFEIAKYLGDFYYELISIHPFREGNGRTVREFMRQLVLVKFPDYELDYTKVDKKNFLIGVIDRKLYPSLLEYEIYNALTPLILHKQI